MKLPEQWAPLKLNLLLGIVALQFTFASIAFIVRFKHHPPSHYQMAETNVRAGPSPPLPLSLSLLSSFSTRKLSGRRAKLGQMGVFCISLYGTATAKRARMITTQPGDLCVSKSVVNCLFRTYFSIQNSQTESNEIKRVTGQTLIAQDATQGPKAFVSCLCTNNTDRNGNLKEFCNTDSVSS